MPRKISASSRHIPVSNLDPTSFAPFGEVIQNPRTHDGEPALQTVEANQGSATKWLDVSHMENFYGKSSSGQEAKSVMNMFVCRPRKLREGRLFDVGIMERHPYTPQTFVPMGLGREDKETAYLIIVAPTLPREAWEVCEAQVSGQESLETRLNQMELAILEADNRRRLLISQRQQKGIPFHGPVRINPRPDQRGPPDLRGLKAFIARGDQAVTYGAGTWHAPMIVLGEREIEFLVVQYANGVAEEDCQEVEFKIEDGGEGVEVDIAAEDVGSSDDEESDSESGDEGTVTKGMAKL